MQIPTPEYMRFVVDFVDAVTTRPLLEDLARSRRGALAVDWSLDDLDDDHRDAA